MDPQELNKCLQTFYVSARKRDGSFYNKQSLTAIRAALDRYLRSPPINKPFSIVGDSQFTEANKTLNNFLKTLHKKGDIAPTVHKQPLTKEHVDKLYAAGELVEFDSVNPGKLQQTAWFFISLFLGKRGRENQHMMKKNMLVLRQSANGESFLEISRERGAVLATKNHQGGLDDKDDESNGKIFEISGSKRCPVKVITEYLSHLSPQSSNLFQKPRNPCKSFNPASDSVWYCSSPLGHNTIENMLRGMTTRAGIQPHLTNHSIRATTVTVLSAANYESRHIKAITGHRSEASIESYSDRPTFQQFKAMSNAIASSLVLDGSSTDLCLPESTTSTTSSSATSSQNPAVAFNNGQQLLHSLIPGGTFHGCSFTFNMNVNASSSTQQNL